MTESKVASARKLLDNGTPRREVAEHLGVSLPTLYRWVPGASQEAATARIVVQKLPSQGCFDVQPAPC